MKVFKTIYLKYALFLAIILAIPSFIMNIGFGYIPIWAWVMLYAASIPFTYMFIMGWALPIFNWLLLIIKKKK